MPSLTGTLEEAIRVTGILKTQQEREDVLARSRRVLDMAVAAGVTGMRVHPDVDTIQGLIGLETALTLKQEYADLLDMQVVAFPQEGILKSPGTLELMEEAMRLGADVVGGCPYAERTPEDSARHIELVFELARKYDAPVDMHADFADDTSDPRFAVCACVAQRTIAHGYQGRVVARPCHQPRRAALRGGKTRHRGPARGRYPHRHAARDRRLSRRPEG